MLALSYIYRGIPIQTMGKLTPKQNEQNKPNRRSEYWQTFSNTLAALGGGLGGIA